MPIGRRRGRWGHVLVDGDFASYFVALQRGNRAAENDVPSDATSFSALWGLRMKRRFGLYRTPRARNGFKVFFQRALAGRVHRVGLNLRRV